MIGELVGKGWIDVDPPLDRDPMSVIARVNGRPIKAGFTMEREEQDDSMYCKFRTGRYDLELNVDAGGGFGRIRVEEAEGYDQ